MLLSFYKHFNQLCFKTEILPTEVGIKSVDPERVYETYLRKTDIHKKATRNIFRFYSTIHIYKVFCYSPVIKKTPTFYFQ